MRYLIISLIALGVLTGCVAPPHRTSVTVGVASPGVRMSVHVPVYPDMEPVPGYPVYYAPGLGYNYFFYDGLYWVYYGDYWYSSAWYNGPWDAVHPYYVPTFILRIPVRYYRVPPRHFHGWHPDAPPRWSDRWGRDWERRRHGWDHWDRRHEPARAPLPHYQRDYSGPRYPQAMQQQQLSRDHYRYQPADSMGREPPSRGDRREPWAPEPGRRDPSAMGMPAGPAPNAGTAPVHMGRDAPAREQPHGMPNSGDMPPQMRRDDGPRPDAQPMPARPRERDERRGGSRSRDRDDDRDDNRRMDRRGGRNGDRDNGDRHQDRRGMGAR